MKRTLCIYATSFAFFTALSLLLGRIFCIAASALVIIAIVVTSFILPRKSRSLFRDAFIGQIFILTALLIALTVTLPQLDSARQYDGEYVTAVGTVRSVKRSDRYTVAVVRCNIVNGEEASHNICIITRNEYADGIDIGMRVSFGGNAEFTDSLRSKGNECFLSVFPTYCDLLGTDGVLDTFVYNTRERICEIVNGMENSHLLKALMIGDKSGISEELEDDFVRIGTSHVLAISGLHLSIVVMTFYSFVAKAGIPNKLASVLSVVLALFYLLIAGSSLSLLRAAQMTVIFFFAKLIRRKKDGITSLFFAGFVILLMSQWAMFNVGFLLSFFATFGILVFVSPISRAFRKRYFDRRESGIVYTRRQLTIHRILDMLISSLATTASATVCTLPIVLLTFNEVSCFSLVGNLVSLPIVKYFLITSFASVLMKCCYLSIPAIPLTFLSEMLGKALIGVTDILSRAAPDTISVRSFYLTVGVVIMTVIVLFFVFRARNWRSLPILAAIILLYIPAFNLVSDGLIYNTAVIDVVSYEGVHTSLVRWRGETYLLDHTASDSKKLGDLTWTVDDQRISSVDKAVFISDNEDIDERIAVLVTMLEIGEIAVITNAETDFDGVRAICNRESIPLKIVNGERIRIADGITAFNASGITSAFVIENGEESLSVCRLFSEDEYLREPLDADVTIVHGKYIPMWVNAQSDGHYRLNE